MAGSVHIVGAGLAGLSAAVELATRGHSVTLYEATNQAGGRCRSYFDSSLGMEIDNGNHLILSGNRATMAYLDAIGARDRLEAAPEASFPFLDLANGERWTVRANDGPIPWWIFDKTRRVPGTKVTNYLALSKLLRPRAGATVGETVDCRGQLYDRLIGPFLLAALNLDPPSGSAELAAAVIRETLAVGGKAYHPMIARDGLSNALVGPAIAHVVNRGGSVKFGHRLRNLNLVDHGVSALDFGDASVAISAGDTVILAVPPPAASALLPGLSTPAEFRSIVNAHYRIDPPFGTPLITGVVNGLTEWVFAFPGRLSVTISGADRLLDLSREELATRIWPEVAAVAGIDTAMPAWQIVRERRATFAATPTENKKRPGARTVVNNVFLAGDWTQTGLPATIEGAIRSGVTAAGLIATR